ncbi:MAG: hypothetical protein MRJ65_00205 [Candidatus Brocadiaceae bacterium]|nr:hypothetical protein [Candidatus Brocadiaceae bacterium]
MKKRLLRLISVAIITISPVLTGCLSLEKKYPGKQYFLFDIPGQEKKPAPSMESTILHVQGFRIAPQYEGKGFVYRLEDLSYETDFYNEFFIPPGLLITEEIRQRLASSGLFQYVVDTSGYGVPTYTLEGVITALYGDYRQGGSAKAIMEIQFFFINTASKDSEIAFQKRYHKEISLPERAPGALVQGWNMALQLVLTEFETDIYAHIMKGNN